MNQEKRRNIFALHGFFSYLAGKREAMKLTWKYLERHFFLYLLLIAFVVFVGGMFTYFIVVIPIKMFVHEKPVTFVRAVEIVFYFTVFIVGSVAFIRFCEWLKGLFIGKERKD